jgi:hypothetical protein
MLRAFGFAPAPAWVGTTASAGLRARAAAVRLRLFFWPVPQQIPRLLARAGGNPLFVDRSARMDSRLRGNDTVGI